MKELEEAIEIWKGLYENKSMWPVEDHVYPEKEALPLVIEAAEWKECYRNCYIQSEIKRYHDEMVKEYGLEGTPSDTTLAKTEEGGKV